MRRWIWECKACLKRKCTVRMDPGVEPVRCICWYDCSSWVRKDKHEQSALDEYGVNPNPPEEQRMPGLGWGLY